MNYHMNVLHKNNTNEFNKNWRRKEGGKCFFK